MDWARTHGADVINLSRGTGLSRDQVVLVQPTFTAARAAGILVVAASGNSGTPIMEYPAGLDGVLSVGAVGSDDVVADFSTFNRAVDLTAPGVETLSTIFGGYEREAGTSMAAPHVAGVAALIWAARPGLDVDGLEAVLRTTAVDLGDPGRDDRYGSGRVDAAAALTGAVPDPLPDLEPAPGPSEPLMITFTAPIAPVVQTSHSTTVSWTLSHAAIDGVMVRLRYRLESRECPDDPTFYDDQEVLPFESPTTDTGLAAGFCYRYDAIAIDEDGDIAETISESVTILDLTKPRITSRTPAPGATSVKHSSSIRIVFSEAVRGVSRRTLRLRNLETGLWVRTKVHYSSARHAVSINPDKSMFHGTRYRVVVGSGIRDRSGNKLAETHWTFRTSP
jgi:Subtilase family/Bacterial Ig-like domain